jgi:hypothetical protein
VLQQSLAELSLTDHRRAFHAYAVRRGLHPAFDADGSRLTIGGPGLRATVHFGPRGRVDEISASMGAATP